jgi:hypothetical protein
VATHIFLFFFYFVKLIFLLLLLFLIFLSLFFQKIHTRSYVVKTDTDTKVGGKFDKSTPKTELDYSIQRAKQMPGPGQYKAANSHIVGGIISPSVLKSDIDWQIYRTSQMPAGESYQTEKAYKHLETKKGGKFNPSRPKSELDHKIRTASQLPGPGDYQLKRLSKVTYHTPVTFERKESFDSSGKVAPFF